MNDTAETEDTGDSGEADSDTTEETVDTDTTIADSSDTTGESCEFSFVDAGGYTVSLGNELTVLLENDDPEEITANSAETTRFRLTSLHRSCETLAVTEIPVEVFASDNAGTEWMLTTLFIMTGELAYNEEGKLVTRLDWVLVIPPGESKSVVISIDQSGAADEDMVKVNIETGLKVYDHDSWAYIVNEPVEGGTLVIQN